MVSFRWLIPSMPKSAEAVMLPHPSDELPIVAGCVLYLSGERCY